MTTWQLGSLEYMGQFFCDYDDDDDVVGKLQTGLIKVSSTVLGGMHLGIA